ncbi:unnamed protein product [Diabrotica balteata]|uniref:Protein I'm not dead yet n=1 Tax=Diabrotica balteata TaxID=107213 RepID=A0A9N9T0G1_DIABA|nr:unnamed protein product [Diabrotica balteata]
MTRFMEFVKIYWKSLFTIFWPFIPAFIFIYDYSPPYRCIYVVIIMCGYWITECIPPPITSLIPMILFPLMGILSSDKVAANYMNDTNMMLIGSIVIAIAMEESRLHIRIALYVIKFVGCSIKRLHIGLCVVTAFISMWIANTAATALMLPIVEGSLVAMQEQGLLQMWNREKDAKIVNKDGEEEEDLSPTDITMCYYISIAYLATIGGTGCIIGSGSHLAYKGIYETRFPDGPGVEFAKWMMFNIPIMTINGILTITWMQFWFFGLFRPRSRKARAVNLSAEAERVAKEIIEQKIQDLKALHFSEIVVGVSFILCIVLWFFRRPGFMTGWPKLITDVKVGDAVVAIIIVMVVIIIPFYPDFIYFFTKDEDKRPVAPTRSIVSWKTIEHKMHWGLLFILGGGFAMADAAKESGMTGLIANSLKSFLQNDKIYILIVCIGMASIITQFLSSNVACVTILTPIIMDMSVVAEVHPMYLGLAVALACCLCFLLPVSTPPNALIAGPCRVKGIEMAKAGIGVYFICLTTLICIFPLYAPVIWDLQFPDWVK